MNKQLWKAIGLQRKSFSISNISQCSTIKLADCPNELLNENSHDDDYPFNTNDRQRLNKVKSNNLPEIKKSQNAQEYADIEIQMCQSQQQKEQEMTVKDCIQQKKQFFKNKINSILLSVILLKEENESLKKTIKISLQASIKAMVQQYQVLHIQVSEKLDTPSVKCTKCDKSKRIIDRLTRQCWELTEQLKQQSTKNSELSKNIESKRQQENNPLKRIQEGLLFERGQSIRNIKILSQQMEIENQKLKNALQSAKIGMQKMQITYKDHLSQFQTELQEINEYMTKKIEEMSNSKHLLQRELIALNKKYSNLQFQYQITKQKKTSSGHSYHNYEHKSNSYGITHSQKSNPQFSHKQSLKGLKYLDMIKFSCPEIKQQSSTSNFNLNKANQIYNSVSYLPISKVFQRKKPYQKTQTSNSSRRQSDILINESQSISYNLVMDRLTQLQRQVQKQIKRSKISSK